ncbi:P-loop NTPase fold protein [Rheinheimera faecalis]|uniref:P-loop NTPase fold protein n=1 Tax=Rheinheimera faecalis TaxID=2901141 RepID=UPI001E313BA0|nr:P-loop NTPase fold protein [Rheinheimera faecalis]
MSTELVKQQIKAFLSTSAPEVLAIKGDWGVGKTHCWDKCIEEFKDQCALTSYSYVSLFGVNSIDALKQLTLLNAIDAQTIGQKKNAKAQAKMWVDRFKSVKLPIIDQYISGIGEAFSSLSQLALKETIICFDDIERHSEGLKIKDFMGLVSFFKERKDCKIVLLLNEDSTDKSFEDYKKYKEKIVDRQLHFEPTAEQSFDTMYETDFEFRSYVRDCCIGLNIKNKRVIIKIVEHTKEFLALVDTFDDEIKRQVIHSTVVLSWCYYCHGEDPEHIPEFKFVNRSGLRKKDESHSWDAKKTKNWDRFLNSYGFQLTDEIDLAVARGIEQGFLDKEKLITLCQHKQREVDLRKENTKWNKAWEIYHHSFETNDDEVAEAMDAGMRDIASTTSCSQYSDGLKVLRGIGKGELADELIYFFIDKRKDTPEIFDVDNVIRNPFGIHDEKFKDELRKAYLQFNPKPTVTDVLNKRRKSNSYNSSEAEILNELTEEQMYDLFMSFKGEDLTDFIRVFLLISGSCQELAQKVTNTLDKISKISVLNKLRMSKFY